MAALLLLFFLFLQLLIDFIIDFPFLVDFMIAPSQEEERVSNVRKGDTSCFFFLRGEGLGPCSLGPRPRDRERSCFTKPTIPKLLTRVY